MTTVRLEPWPWRPPSKFWQDKIQLGPAEFAKLSDEAKIRAFAVSGIAKGDQLATVYNGPPAVGD